ncbi:Transcriptional repressor MprA [Frondihabitans sp. 762G35]|uniref:MarR family winged helix-turn-helix transcriptional regulator n=1 Tax=Frondihabitans sp. 762G35 TaxID=1446794 RepID=UPI000D222FB4|nr:MarR family transcriptional regulator [Frondihabitans sp. 762G35]ARC55625.1 Transcriptional repressor MprA [Frondihabitans sp. 762G35]
MTPTDPDRHVLNGFPEKALGFFRAVERSRRRVASDHGLSEIELRALFRIGAEGTITPKELADDLGLTKGAITGVSTRLVEAGHVRRVDHPHDRRRLHLALTEAGHVTVGAMHVEFREMLSTAGTELTDAELESAGAVLSALSARILANP